MKPSGKDWIFTILVFMSVGFFVWAIRGTYGYGAIPGSTFGGFGIAMLWYLLSHESGEKPTRRYSSGWGILGIALGIGVNGMHGWMQYQYWRQGIFQNDPFIPIDPMIGYIWWFIAAVPWAGTGAVFLAWSNPEYPTNKTDWLARILFGVIGITVAMIIYYILPSIYLPNYTVASYNNLAACHACAEAIEDTQTALGFMGFFVGILGYEIKKKHWVNVKFSLTVGMINAATWILFQALDVQHFGWRYFEGLAGAGLGLAYAIGLLRYNQPLSPEMQSLLIPITHRNAEVFVGVYLALIMGLGWGLYQAFWGIATRWIVGEKPQILPQYAIPLLIIGLSVLLYVGWFVYTHPLKSGDGKSSGSSFLQIFIIGYLIQRICGFMVNNFTEEHPSLTNIFNIIYFGLMILDILVLRSLHQKSVPSNPI